MKTKSEIDNDPLWLEALRKTRDHWLDAVERTKRNYRDLRKGPKECACCVYFDFDSVEDCHECFLYDNLPDDDACAVEYWEVVEAQRTENGFPAFHAAAFALFNRICAELARVEKIQAEGKHQSAHKKDEIFDETRMYAGEVSNSFLAGRTFVNVDGRAYTVKSDCIGIFTPSANPNTNYREILIPRKQPTSAHKDGEICELPVWDVSQKDLPNKPHHFEHTGKVTSSGDNLDGWYIGPVDSDICHFCHDNDQYTIEILRLVIDEEPTPKPKSARKNGELFNEECSEAIKALHKIEKYIKAGYVHPRKSPRTMVKVWIRYGAGMPEIDDLCRILPFGDVYWKGMYHFKGLPDIDRVIAETLEQGEALAIKVECTEKFEIEMISTDCCRIWQHNIGFIKNLGWFYGEKKHFVSTAISNLIDSDIEAAITTWLEKEKDHEERHLEHLTRMAAQKLYDEEGTGGKQKPKSEFHVEQIVVVLDTDDVCKIIKIKKKIIVRPKNGLGGWVRKENLRHATESEIAEFYTCELGDELVRAYEEYGGGIKLVFPVSTKDLLPNYTEQARALCEAASIPIMSREERQRLYDGEFVPPKGK